MFDGLLNTYRKKILCMLNVVRQKDTTVSNSAIFSKIEVGQVHSCKIVLN